MLQCARTILHQHLDYEIEKVQVIYPILSRHVPYLTCIVTSSAVAGLSVEAHSSARLINSTVFPTLLLGKVSEFLALSNLIHSDHAK